MTTLFENRQSAFHGVQEDFVNTSADNVTFLVRDLVRVGGMPIVMGRVYDSALDGGDAARDFGPGLPRARAGIVGPAAPHAGGQHRRTETPYRKSKERNCTDSEVACPGGERW